MAFAPQQNHWQCWLDMGDRVVAGMRIAPLIQFQGQPPGEFRVLLEWQRWTGDIWGTISWGNTFTPTDADVPEIMRCRFEVREQPSDHALFTDTHAFEVIPHPGPRLSRGFIDSESRRQLGTFNCLTYNVLAPCLATTRVTDLPAEKQWIRRAEYRFGRLVEEIDEYKPQKSILVFQEVERARFKEVVQPFFKHYSFIYHMKSSEMQEGLCIAFDERLFELKRMTPVIFTEAARELAHDPPTTAEAALIDLLRKKKAISLIVKLQLKEWPFRFVTVAAVHLSARTHDTIAEVSRTCQVWMLSNLLEGRVNLNTEGVIICGDFNFGPDSPLYEYITKGEATINQSIVPSVACFFGPVIRNPMGKMHSAYTRVGRLLPSKGDPQFVRKNHRLVAQRNPVTREPQFTFYNGQFLTFDYIFQNDILDCVGMRDLIEESEVIDETGVAMPSMDWISDHEALEVSLKWGLCEGGLGGGYRQRGYDGPPEHFDRYRATTGYGSGAAGYGSASSSFATGYPSGHGVGGHGSAAAASSFGTGYYSDHGIGGHGAAGYGSGMSSHAAGHPSGLDVRGYSSVAGSGIAGEYGTGATGYWSGASSRAIGYTSGVHGVEDYGRVAGFGAGAAGHGTTGYPSGSGGGGQRSAHGYGTSAGYSSGAGLYGGARRDYGSSASGRYHPYSR